MLDIHLTQAAESFYAERASMLGQTVDVLINQTLPREMAKIMPATEPYQPTAEEWVLINEGIASLDAGEGIPHDEVWAEIEAM